MDELTALKPSEAELRLASRVIQARRPARLGDRIAVEVGREHDDVRRLRSADHSRVPRVR